MRSSRGNNNSSSSGSGRPKSSGSTKEDEIHNRELRRKEILTEATTVFPRLKYDFAVRSPSPYLVVEPRGQIYMYAPYEVPAQSRLSIKNEDKSGRSFYYSIDIIRHRMMSVKIKNRSGILSPGDKVTVDVILEAGFRPTKYRAGEMRLEIFSYRCAANKLGLNFESGGHSNRRVSMTPLSVRLMSDEGMPFEFEELRSSAQVQEEYIQGINPPVYQDRLNQMYDDLPPSASNVQGFSGPQINTRDAKVKEVLGEIEEDSVCSNPLFNRWIEDIAHKEVKVNKTKSIKSKTSSVSPSCLEVYRGPSSEPQRRRQITQEYPLQPLYPTLPEPEPTPSRQQDLPSDVDRSLKELRRRLENINSNENRKIQNHATSPALAKLKSLVTEMTEEKISEQAEEMEHDEDEDEFLEIRREMRQVEANLAMTIQEAKNLSCWMDDKMSAWRARARRITQDV